MQTFFKSHFGQHSSVQLQVITFLWTAKSLQFLLKQSGLAKFVVFFRKHYLHNLKSCKSFYKTKRYLKNICLFFFNNLLSLNLPRSWLCFTRSSCSRRSYWWWDINYLFWWHWWDIRCRGTGLLGSDECGADIIGQWGRTL